MTNEDINNQIIFCVEHNSMAAVFSWRTPNSIAINKELFGLMKLVEPKIEKFIAKEICDYTGFLQYNDVKKETMISLEGSSALDFMFYLEKIFKNKGKEFPPKLSSFIDAYTKLCYPNQTQTTPNTCEIKVVLTDAAAVMPSKDRASDTGFDLTVIKIAKTMGDVVLYDTCVQIQPSYGWYVEIVPRSSISKTGYMLANSVGIIDGSYRGNLMVALRKVNKEAPDLELPCRIAQMIPRQFVHPTLTLVDSVDVTERGSGGFGSSNK